MTETIKSYKKMALDEKRFILLELFTIYRMLINSNYDMVEEVLSGLISLWGNNECTVKIKMSLKSMNYGLAIQEIEKVYSILIINTTPANEINGE